MARLEEAVAAYRAALEERTRDRVPLQWAVLSPLARRWPSPAGPFPGVSCVTVRKRVQVLKDRT